MTKPKGPREERVRLQNGEIVRLTRQQRDDLLAAVKANVRLLDGDPTATPQTWVIIHGRLLPAEPLGKGPLGAKRKGPAVTVRSVGGPGESEPGTV